MSIRLGMTLALLLTVLAGCASTTPPAGDASHGAPGAVQLRWAYTTAEPITGFNVLRGDNERGEHFQRINAAPIPAVAPPPAETKATAHQGDYEYLDTGVDAGAAYYYYIESVAADGTRKPISPVARRTAAARDAAH